MVVTSWEPRVIDMLRELIVRGVVAGLLVGLIAGGVGLVAGAPLIEQAIALEGAHEHEAAGTVVSPSQQRAGLVVATMLAGGAFGALFAAMFAAARGRVGPRRPWALALTLGVVVVVVVVFVPLLKYPPNPPGVGDPETIIRRTLLYLLLVGSGMLAVLAGVRVAKAVPGDASAWVRSIVGALACALTIGLALLLLPGVDEVPRDFPPALLSEFRWAAVGTQVLLWLGIASAFGVATAVRE